MANRRLPFPIGLPVAAVILIVVAIVLGPVIRGMPEETLVRNTILNGIPFILIFVAIILFFMTVIWTLASLLNGRVAPQVYKTIEAVIIGGIVLGVVAMFQPWAFVLFRWGFHLLLAATVGFIVWSHIRPAGEQRQEDLTTVDADDIAEPDLVPEPNG
jgi:hypothetical protein